MSREAESRIDKHVNGYVSFGETPEHLQEILVAATTGKPVGWTVCVRAVPGDVLVLYFKNPIGAFVGYGTVGDRLKDTWGERNLPMANLENIRLFERPLRLTDAQKNLDLLWLKTPSGFGNRAHESVGELIEFALKMP